MKALQLFLTGLYVILYLQSCSKREELPSYYISEHVRAFIEFKQGTYWIYSDDSSNVEDSVWVSDLIYTWEAKHNSEGEIIGKDERIVCSVKIESITTANTFGAFQDGVGYSLYDWGFGLPLNPNHPNIGVSIFTKDSLLVDTTYYYNIYNINASLTDQQYSYIHLNTYCKSGIGILKWNIQYRDGHSQSKSLKRYHIIQ